MGALRLRPTSGWTTALTGAGVPTNLCIGELPGSGTYTWHAQKQNSCGTSNATTMTFHINYPPPQPTLCAPVNGANIACQTVSLSWSDPGDPDNWPNNYRTFRIHVWNPTTGWDYDSGWSTTSTSTQITVPSDGAYRWQVDASDGANDQGYCTDWGFTVDTVPPAISLTGPATGVWLNKASGTTSVTWSATDATSGVATQTLTWDNGGLTNASPAQIPEGKRTATITATDNAGNTATQSYGTWWVDTTPPVPSIILNPAQPDGQNGWYVTDPTATVVAVDPNGADGSGVGGRFYTLDSSSEASFTTPVEITGDGIHSLSAKATDVAGNSGTTGAQQIMVDTTPPVFESISTDPESRSLNTLVATWSCSDPDSGVAELTFTG